jgi:hypothetical protein
MTSRRRVQAPDTALLAPRCDSRHRSGVQCAKEGGHDLYHWHASASATVVWSIEYHAEGGGR